MIFLKKSTYPVVVLMSLVGFLDTAAGQTVQLTASPANVVFNVQPGQVSNPQILRLSTSTAQIVPYQIQAATSSGGNWLVFSPATGNTPVDVFVSANSGGLPAGSYSGVLTVSAQGVSNSPLSIPVTLNVGSQISTSPTSLSFNYQAGSSTMPGAQSLAVNSTTNTAVPYNVSVQMTSGGSWLLVNPTSGTTPGNTSVSVNPSGLPAGIYNGSVRFTSTVAGTASYDVPVTLTVTSSPTLTVAPTSVSFAHQVGTAAPPAQVLTFTSNGPAIPFALSQLAGTGGNWLVLNSFSGQASGGQPQQITLNANVAGLLPGTYSTRIIVSAPQSSVPTFEIPVSLLVSNLPLLSLGATPQPFNFQLGGSQPANQTINITSSSTPISFSANATVTGGSNWLTITPSTGTTPQTLTLAANPQGLAPGEYTGTVTIASPGAGNAPISFPVQLNISATTMLNANTGGLTFNYQTTSLQSPPAQIIGITSTGGPLTYSATSTTSACNNLTNWLTLNQATGTTPGNIIVSVTPAGLTPPQSCTATVSITAPGASNTVTVPVTFNVSANPLLNIAPTSLDFTSPAGSTAPLAPKVISLTSTDPLVAIPFNYVVNTQTGGPWLFVASSGGNNTPSNLSITVNPSGLPVGNYQGTVTVTSPNLPAAQTIPVNVSITSTVAAVVSPTAVNLSIPSNATAPVTRQVQITAPDAASPLTFSVSATPLQGANWLSVSPAGGNTPGTVTISANAAGLSQGTYNGQVTVVVPGASNSPISIPVTLTVGPPQTIGIGNTTLNFTHQVGATPGPANQTLNVTSTGGPVQFTAQAATTSCGNFLTVTPASGTTPTALTVAVNTAGLPQGTCQGTITIQAPGMQSQVVNVTLNVTQAAAPAITTVVNAASYAPGPIAPGEIVTLFGANIGPTTLANYQLVQNGTAFATTVADTTVFFDNIPAPIIYVRNDQLSVVVPYEIAGRPNVNITVRRGGQTSAALSQRVVDFAPGIFTTNEMGSGLGAIVNQNNTVNSALIPAPRGSVIAIYVTGAGLMTTNPATGAVLQGAEPLPRLATQNVIVTIGGQPATVHYAGGAPLSIGGLYQINVTVPQGAAPGAQIVSLSVGGAPAQGNVTVFVQ
jgi:uncharacterized protein (TIGR03437 family)